MRFAAVALLSLIASVSPLSAQNPVQPTFAACPPLTHVYSEREVQVSAKSLVDTTTSPRPLVVHSGDRNTIAFVVDTLGKAETGSLVPLRLADTLLWKRVQAEYRRWLYQPAMASGCKVRQRVVAAVKR